MDYRHEQKIQINYADLLTIRQRLQAICRLDEHSVDGRYHVRSLYFDNLEDKALREKLDGISRREKFRIRYYNLDPSFIRLEKKSKKGGMGCKQYARISREEAQRIVDGDIDWMKDADRLLVRELYIKMRTQGLLPKTMVDYTRESYTYLPGNVRVTLDYDIRTSLGCTNFLDPDSITVPVEGSPIIMEIKWDGFIPSIIQDAIQLPGRYAASFSKYASSRMYD